MRKRRADTDEDDGPKLISLQDKHAADRLLHEAFAAGAMDEAEFKRRRGRVYAAVTPRELWKASGHRAGSRERADKAAIIMVFVLFGTILNSQGGTVNTPVFPWEWGRDEPTSSEQR